MKSQQTESKNNQFALTGRAAAQGALKIFHHPISGVLLLLIVYVFLNIALERTTQLPTENFFSSFLLLEYFEFLGWRAAFVALGAFIFFRYADFLMPWSDIENGPSIRVFIVLLAVTISWPLILSGHNYYFDQSYIFDKLALIILMPLIYWRPAFLLIFIVPAYLLLWQLNQPALGGSVLAHKLQIIRLLGIFVAALILFTVTGRRKSGPFLVLSCAFVATAYWLPAIAKLNLAWLSENHLYFMPLNAYAHGWLAFLDADEISSIAQQIKPFDYTMKVLVVVVEALSLVIFFRKSILVGLLFAWTIFHLGVFVLYGFLFWTWIMIDLALVYLVMSIDKEGHETIYGGQLFVLSVLLIVLGSWWAKPPPLAWYDTPVTYTYRVEAKDNMGNVTAVHPRFFGSYSDVVTFGSFGYLVENRSVLTGSYGVTGSSDIYRSLLAAKSADDIFSLEQRTDQNRFNAARADRLKEFLSRFLTNKLSGEKALDRLQILSAPPQFWSQRGEIPNMTDLVELSIVEYTNFFDGTKLQQIRRQELWRFALSDVAGR